LNGVKTLEITQIFNGVAWVSEEEQEFENFSKNAVFYFE